MFQWVLAPHTHVLDHPCSVMGAIEGTCLCPAERVMVKSSTPHTHTLTQTQKGERQSNKKVCEVF